MNGKMTSQSKRYLLILPCSKRKKAVHKAPAIELYNGPFYRMLRKNMPKKLDILILSARYSLISYNEEISYYEKMMTVKRAEELENDVRVKLEETLKNNHYEGIFINLGKTYMLALEKSEKILSKQNVYRANGKIGERLHLLKNWLAEIDMESEGDL